MVAAGRIKAMLEILNVGTGELRMLWCSHHVDQAMSLQPHSEPCV